MDLRDLVIEVGSGERAAYRNNDQNESNYDSDEDYMDSSPMQILEYAESQQPVERIKLACIVRDLSSPPTPSSSSSSKADASKKQQCAGQG
jgi:hypothetical protein